MTAADLLADLADLERTLGSIEAVLDPASKRAEIAELSEQVAAPDLWDDQENAQRVTSRLSRLQSEVDRLVKLRDRIDDLKVLIELAQEENDAATLAEAQKEFESLRGEIEALEVRTLLSGEYDQREALITIRSEAGGVDAADFAAMLLRMYLRWAERHGYATEVYETSEAEEAGIKSATFTVKEPFAYGMLSVEQGTHRLVRISPFDNQGRRQTSFAGVDVFPVTEEIDHIDIPEKDLRVDVFRSTGPGGQSVNTTDSAVRLTHIPTGIVVSMQNEKSQLQNREAAMRVLRARILAKQQEELDAAASDARKSQIRSMDRSERIRTYNFPENRIADHRTGYKAYNLDQVMNGALQPVIDACVQMDEEARLAALGSSDD